MSQSQNKASLYTFLSCAATESHPGSGIIRRALQVIREHLGMDVAYVSEIVGDTSVFREVDAPGQEALIKAGDSHQLSDVYCGHILAGRLPELIPDTSEEPIARAMPITKAASIGAHISVPIHLSDGSLYGMFCCLSFKADTSLSERDLKMMHAFADLAAFEISREMQGQRARNDSAEQIRRVIDNDLFAIHYQPIWNLEQKRPVGLECLTRFNSAPEKSPDVWFRKAAEAGLGQDLEVATLSHAIKAWPSMPEGTHIALNASPEAIQAKEIHRMIQDAPGDRFVLEITEHAHIKDYAALNECLAPLRRRGVRIAVDDAGAGYSCLKHILHLNPDVIKLDMSLTRQINFDPAKRALTTALVRFAAETGSRIVAEGVETQSELLTLHSLGVEKAQGYLLGRPAELEQALKIFENYSYPAVDTSQNPARLTKAC